MKEYPSKNIAEVLELNQQRISRGYQPGWLYYRCKDKGLLAEFEFLKSKGQIIVPFTTSKNDVESSEKKLLTVELVPETCWFSNVRSNVTQKDWKRLRQETAKKARYKCEICGGQGPKWPVECHEKWEYYESSMTQKLLGLISLCPSCHEVKHMGFAKIKGRKQIAMDYLAKINNWTPAETSIYVRQQFEIWSNRSRCNWDLDVSWLETKGIQINQTDRSAVCSNTSVDELSDDYENDAVHSHSKTDCYFIFKICFTLGLIAFLIRIFLLKI